jgi:hypothetical protein
MGEQFAQTHGAQLEDQLTVNTQHIIDLMPKAAQAGIPFDTFAKLVGERERGQPPASVSAMRPASPRFSTTR